MNPDLPAVDPSSSHLLPTSFGSQLVTQAGKRLRPEYVSYARVAKKVDVRRLKENMWRGMSGKLAQPSSVAAAVKEGAEEEGGGEAPPTPAPTLMDDMDIGVDLEKDAQMDRDDGAAVGVRDGLKFTTLIRDLTSIYPPQQMRDISTSYCFICLLHLANEKGLLLQGDYPPDRGEIGMGEGEGKDKGKDLTTGLMREIIVRRDDNVGLGYVGE